MQGLLGMLLLGIAIIVLTSLHQRRSTGAGSATPRSAVIADTAPAITIDGGSATMQTHEPEVGAPALSHDPVRTRPRERDLLTYGACSGDGRPHLGGYAALAILTSGYAPFKDAIVELAVVRTDGDGHCVQRYATLVRPDSRESASDTLGTIDTEDLLAAPTFTELAPVLAELLAGTVVVTHHAGHVGRFLAAGFLRAGVLCDTMPALSVDRLGAGVFGTPNLRAATLARHLRRVYPLPATAADQADLIAACLPPLLARFGSVLRYPCTPTDPTGWHRDGLVVPAVSSPPAGSRRRGGRGSSPRTTPDTLFLAELLTQAPISVQELNDPAVAAYLEDVTALLTQQRIVKTEVGDLAQRLVRAGTTTEQIRAISARLLESLREAAFGCPRLSPTQLRHLRAAATSLGNPEYFDDLLPPPSTAGMTPNSGSFARPIRKPRPSAPPSKQPRCGYCLQVGHWIAGCPLPCPGTVGAITLGAIAAVESTHRIQTIRSIGPT